MSVWEVLGVVAFLVVIIVGIAVATYYERDLWISLLGRDRE